MLMLAGSLLAADSAKDDVKAAAKKLAEKSNYSWKTTTENAGGGGFRMGPIEGKTEKGGATLITMNGQNGSTEAVLKGTEKGAIKTDEGWQSLSEAAEGEGPGRFRAMMLRNFKTPAMQAEDIAGKTKGLTATDGVYSGELTEEGAKSLLSFGGRGGGGGPEISGAKGSAKFWTKEGVISKFEYTVKGKVSFNGNDRDVDRTTTVEIKDVDSTKVTVPEGAAKKLS